MSFSELITIAALYNMFVRKAVKDKTHIEKGDLTLKKIVGSEFATPKRLAQALNDRFASVCRKGDDQCWIEHPILKTGAHNMYKKLQNRFRPHMPSSWSSEKENLLNTFDIFNVLKQYEDKYNDFEFLGVFPLDFMELSNSNNKCIIGDICHLQMKKYIDHQHRFEKKQFAMVHNMDPHDEPGSHWVSLYMNIDPKDPRFGFSYYDSYGYPESYQVKKLYASVTSQIEKLNIQIPPFERNTKRHQYKNTECGMFSILFIVLCLENKKPIKKLYNMLDQPHADDRMAGFRPKFFRK